MIDVNALAEDEFDKLVDKSLEIYSSLISDVLPFSSEDAYQKVMKLNDNDDVSIVISLRNVTDEDEISDDLATVEDLVCAEISYSEDIKDQTEGIHVVNIIFSPSDDGNDNISASWFIE